ncbi:MAG TPA: hypothetical protein VH640_27535 [Bryobacteraceae bacterium]|jgi:hypothetical protein
MNRHEKDMRAIRSTLRRAARLAIEDERRERVRRAQREARFNDMMTNLAAAQLLAEEQTTDCVRPWRTGSAAGGNSYPPPA